MKKWLGALLGLSALVLSGCGGNGGFFNEPNNIIINPGSPADARFNIPPASLSDIPFPDDIVRDPNTGLNNLPGASGNEQIADFNSISGFSTAGTVEIPLDGAVDATTVTAASVLVLNTHNNTLANVTIGTKSDGNGNSIITVTPAVPLPDNTTFIAIVTPSVLTASNHLPLVSNAALNLTKLTTSLVNNGTSAIPGLSNSDATALEPIREALQPVWAAAAATTHLTVAEIPLAFSFKTQDEFGTLQALRDNAHEQSPVPNTPQATVTVTVTPDVSGTPVASATTFDNPLTSQEGIATFAQAATNSNEIPTSHIGKIVFGSFNAPNFQNGDVLPTGFFDQASPNELPTQHGTNTITFIACFPATQTPVPCVIFQHGFTRSNLDVMAIADSICSTGLGVIAINLQLHGDRGIPGETSGTGFVNLVSLRSTRDNIRQSVSDLDNLAALIVDGQTAFDPTSQNALFTTNQPEYIGQSLGGIVGTTYVTVDDNVSTAVLNVPGGRLTSLLANSPTFSVLLTDPDHGLPAFGIQPNTPEFDQFLYLAQTVVDDGDPFNYAAHMGLSNPTAVSIARSTNAPAIGAGRDLTPDNSPLNVLIQEMIGDQVVPNSALNDLALACNITQAVPSTTTANFPFIAISTPLDTTSPFTLATETIPPGESGLVGSGLFQFAGSEHGFLLSPTTEDPNGILTAEGQQQAVFYLLTGELHAPEITVPDPPDLRTENAATTLQNYIQHPSALIYTGH